MDGLSSSTTDRRAKAQRAVAGATAVVGAVAAGAAGALALGLGNGAAAATVDPVTSQVDDQQQGGGWSGPSGSAGQAQGRGPVGTSGGS